MNAPNRYLGVMKQAQSVSYRPLSFYDKNKSALLTSAILALIGGAGGALIGKKRKNRIWRAIAGAILGGAVGSGLGHLHDKSSFESRLKGNGRDITKEDIHDAYETLKNFQTDAQYDYMHRRHIGVPATSIKELGNAWSIGSFGSNINEGSVIARIKDSDVTDPAPKKGTKLEKATLRKPYRYGILSYPDSPRTPVAVALPEYDADNGPGLVHIMPIRKDPADYYKPIEQLLTKVHTPEGKSVLRDLVMQSKPLTKEILEKLK